MHLANPHFVGFQVVWQNTLLILHEGRGGKLCKNNCGYFQWKFWVNQLSHPIGWDETLITFTQNVLRWLPVFRGLSEVKYWEKGVRRSMFLEQIRNKEKRGHCNALESDVLYCYVVAEVIITGLSILYLIKTSQQTSLRGTYSKLFFLVLDL